MHSPRFTCTAEPQSSAELHYPKSLGRAVSVNLAQVRGRAAVTTSHTLPECPRLSSHFPSNPIFRFHRLQFQSHSRILFCLPTVNAASESHDLAIPAGDRRLSRFERPSPLVTVRHNPPSSPIFPQTSFVARPRLSNILADEQRTPDLLILYLRLLPLLLLNPPTYPSCLILR